jgi:glycyl-tRNA synthetase beta chain
MPELLLEIGCEELPAPWLSGLARQLEQKLVEAAGRERLDPQDVRVLWTPRRLVVGAQLVAGQDDREEQVWGPALKVARNDKGWTPAALGFARKSGVDVEALQQGPKEGAPDTYLFAVKKTPGRATREVLPAVVAQCLRGLAFPKRMSWDAWLDDGKGLFPFGRPIRWLVVLFEGAVVPFTIFSALGAKRGAPLVSAGAVTWGHRFLPRGTTGQPIAVASLRELKDRLRDHAVLLDPEERTRRIQEGLRALSAGGELHDEDGLAAEWRDLVEYPTVVGGTIPSEFHGLPVEVLQTVLVHHQKYVPIVGHGTVERFAAIVNTDESNAAAIVRGMERVVVARLRDAAFFFAEDRKRTLAERASDLAGVTFHQKLGSYLDKSERMARLVGAMADQGVLAGAFRAAAQGAARLAKADLTTLMVREFAELQGTMGGIYLRAEGADEAVAEAVRWHYHPLSVEEDAAPQGRVGGRAAALFAAVSLADKIDTLAGYFGIGEAPTGSRDPFGLRRAGQGAVRVLLDFWPAEGVARPSLQALVAEALAGYTPARPEAEVRAELEAFLLERLDYVLATRFPKEEVEAVLGTPGADALQDPFDALVRVRALHGVRGEAAEDFAHLATAFKRAKNILQNQPAPEAVKPALFEAEAERALHAAVSGLSGGDGGYEARLRALAALSAPVDRFFTDVMVMADDPRVRANRLGLLQGALSLFYRIADISRLGGSA